MSASANRTWLEHYPEWTDHHLDYGDTTLIDVYDQAIEQYPDRIALRFFGRGWTYTELDEQVRRAAAELRAHLDTLDALLDDTPALERELAAIVEARRAYTAAYGERMIT